MHANRIIYRLSELIKSLAKLLDVTPISESSLTEKIEKF
jgi:hypothetical protein